MTEARLFNGGVAGGTNSSGGINGAVQVVGRVVVEFDLEDGAECKSGCDNDFLKMLYIELRRFGFISPSTPPRDEGGVSMLVESMTAESGDGTFRGSALLVGREFGREIGEIEGLTWGPGFCRLGFST